MGLKEMFIVKVGERWGDRKIVSQVTCLNLGMCNEPELFFRDAEIGLSFFRETHHEAVSPKYLANVNFTNAVQFCDSPHALFIDYYQLCLQISTTERWAAIAGLLYLSSERFKMKSKPAEEKVHVWDGAAAFLQHSVSFPWVGDYFNSHSIQESLRRKRSRKPFDKLWERLQYLWLLARR